MATHTQSRLLRLQYTDCITTAAGMEFALTRVFRQNLSWREERHLIGSGRIVVPDPGRCLSLGGYGISLGNT